MIDYDRSSRADVDGQLLPLTSHTEEVFEISIHIHRNLLQRVKPTPLLG
jgi:hypothetical protein